MMTHVASAEEQTLIRMKTSLGVIDIAMYDEKAPATVANFLAYVDAGFFNGVIFHRVIPGFMIQGGGFETGMRQKQNRAPVRNEADNGLKNKIGTLSMARTSDPHSATSQFFINLADNAFLDYASGNPGYAVFAGVVEGMDTVRAIGAVKTGNSGHFQNVPVEDVLIVEAVRVK